MAMITKEASSQRLIIAAAAMLASNFDPLAVHVVAASALRVLKDLVEKTGSSYEARTYAASLYFAAESKRLGKSGSSVPHPGLVSIIDQIVAGIEDGSIESPDDIHVEIPAEVARSAMAHITAGHNFLKHADRDPDGRLDERTIDAAETLMHAVNAYALLYPGKPIPSDVAAFLLKAEVIDTEEFTAVIAE